MIWKIFFFLSTIFLMSANILLCNMDYPNTTSLQYSIAILQTFSMVFITCIFYSLGWKQKLFSKQATNLLITIFILSILAYLVNSALLIFPTLYSQTQNAIVSIIVSIFAMFIITVIISLFLIPFYIGLYKYKKHFDSLLAVDKPYWKMFSIYCIPVLLGFIISAITKYTHFNEYNLFDYCVIFSWIYEICFITGFSWNIKIFNNLFWKITMIPYVLLTISSPFLISDMFNQDYHFKEIIWDNPVSLIFTVVQAIALIYMVYKYAFSIKKQNYDI